MPPLSFRISETTKLIKPQRSERESNQTGNYGGVQIFVSIGLIVSNQWTRPVPKCKIAQRCDLQSPWVPLDNFYHRFHSRPCTGLIMKNIDCPQGFQELSGAMHEIEVRWKEAGLKLSQWTRPELYGFSRWLLCQWQQVRLDKKVAAAADLCDEYSDWRLSNAGELLHCRSTQHILTWEAWHDMKCSPIPPPQ